MLNLEAIQFADANAQTRGVVVFEGLTASPYFMKDDDGKTNAGISFPYEGGKFSCPIDPLAGEQLAKVADRQKLSFDKIELFVEPASFGREKRAGLRATGVKALYVGKTAVYTADEAKK